MNYFLVLICFATTFTYANSYSRLYPMSCEGNELLSNYNTVVYRFSLASECRKALEESRSTRGYFCDSDNLVLSSGQVFHNFTWRSQCQDALNELRISRSGLFCDNASMYQIHLGYLNIHRSASNCRTALAEARNHGGLFCRDAQMYDQRGRLIRHYPSSINCKDALRSTRF
jgi:hypothetical protein